MRTIAILSVLFALPACGIGSSAPSVSDLNVDFDSAAVGELPIGFHATETNSRRKLGTWVVAEDGAGKCIRLTQVENEGDTYNLLMSDAVLPADLRIAVRVRADGGEEDQGGGVFWRGRGPTDYYITRWNPLEDNVRLYKVERGVRTQFASAKVTATPGWHDLVVEVRGGRMTVAFDGKALLDHTDATFSGAGHVGLWTKADAATSFDDLVVTALN
ncbi:MAG: hypothetical protein AB7I19_05720 [Planctomycetota bacterium]